MFRKILIAEDFDSYSLGVKRTIEELNIIPIIDQVFYCDDALLKIQRALLDQDPYDLLITDLSFASDYREQRISGGEELIKEAKKDQPYLKVIVFSIENRFYKIKSMFDDYQINGFVTKGRDDSKELKKAIIAINNNQTYISHDNKESKQSHVYEFTEYDINLLKLLSQGFTQKQVELYLKEKHISPNSESSIEKRLAFLRESFDAKDTKQLLGIVIELGFI